MQNDNQFPLIHDFLYFIKERDSVRMMKEAGAPRPWTKDAVLRTYRFCNIRREDDKVTRWIEKNWRSPWRTHQDAWFAMAVSRLFNEIPTLEAISKFVLPWRPEKVKEVLLKRKAQGLKIFSPAYTISTHGVSKEKIAFVVEDELTPMWERREELRYRGGESLADFHTRLMTCNGIKSFLGGQIVADTKYCGEALKAPDWHLFAVVGPGSAKGLNWLRGEDPETRWKSGEWRTTLLELKDIVDLECPELDLHAQDIQNCLCEFEKWCRTKFAGSRPRQRYTPEVSK